MRSFISSILNPIILVGVLLLVTACNSVGSTSAGMDATVTPLPGQMTATTRPTSTPAPSPTPDVAATEDFLEGMRQLEASNFEQAVAAFRRAYQAAPYNEQVRTELARAYLKWGQALVTASEGKPEQLSEAADKFVSGLGFAPEENEVYTSLQWEQNVVQLFLQGVLDLEELVASRKNDVDLETQQKQAEAVLALFAEAYGIHPALPGLRDKYAAALLITARIVEELGDKQDTRAAAKPYWEKAEELSKQGQEIVFAADDTRKDLVVVAQRVDEKINPPPTPVPQPTARPGSDPGPGPGPGTNPPAQQLVVIPDVRGADVGQARAYLQQLGFAAAVAPLPAGQDGSLCNGWVSYTSPPKGTSAPLGSQVILFYRSWDQPNPPGC